VVYGISPSVVPRPSDWPRNIAQFGNWFLESPSDAALPPEVAEFLDAGPPPVFVHGDRIGVTPRGDFLTMVLRALSRLSLRGLLSGPPPPERLPDSVLHVPPVPFDRLFPRVAGVVHHGGAGTTATGLQAGT